MTRVEKYKVARTALGIVLVINGKEYLLGSSADALREDLELAVRMERVERDVFAALSDHRPA